ncbi:hypothetical protein [Kocuria rosea]|uniref:hypothetical protein n=1 Tax=Kocuria rosea TaxID=1275 RepID=UPI0012FC42F7|nr:hypothetical protein [Kocuria polaris]
MKLQGTTADGHLFPPPVDVAPGNDSISAHLAIRNRTTGEVAGLQVNVSGDPEVLACLDDVRWWRS